VQVQNAYYQLSSADVLGRLKPGNYNVTAYYLPAIDGTIGEVYLYQDNVFVCCSNKIEKFADAQAEWTDKDNERMMSQAKYISHFDKTRSEGASGLAKLGTISEDMSGYDSVPVEVVADVSDNEELLGDDHGEFEFVMLDDYRQRAFDNA
jgi:hypothetical protein